MAARDHRVAQFVGEQVALALPDELRATQARLGRKRIGAAQIERHPGGRIEAALALQEFDQQCARIRVRWTACGEIAQDRLRGGSCHKHSVRMCHAALRMRCRHRVSMRTLRVVESESAGLIGW